MQTRDLIAKVRKIEIKTRKIVEDIAGGAYHSMFKGRGIEFSEVRAYTHGDDVRDIDWNVTARMGAPYVKKYVEERELTVMLAVDVSPSTAFGSGADEKRDVIAEAAALLAFSAIRNNDKVGLLLFSDREEFYLPPKSGRRHVLRLIRELVAFRPGGQRRTDLNVPLRFLARTVKKRAAVFLIGDFVDSGDFELSLKLLARTHDVAAFRVLDPLETALPFRAPVQFEDAETSETFFAAAAPEAFAAAAGARRSSTDAILRKAKVDSVDLRCGADIVPDLIRFFKSRRLASRRF